MLGRLWLCWTVGTATLGERAAAILRDEIEHGALANIAAARQVWSTHQRALLTPEATRRLAAEFRRTAGHHARRSHTTATVSSNLVAATTGCHARLCNKSRAANDGALAHPPRPTLRPTRRRGRNSYPSAERPPDPMPFS